MLKRRILGLSVTAFAMTAIVGSGFSAWIFNRDVRGDVLVDSIFVTHANTFGNVSVGEIKYRLQLDQGTASAAEEGITVLSSTGASSDFETASAISATWEVTDLNYSDTYNDEGIAQVGYYINIYLKKDTIAKYVKVAGDFTKCAGTTVEDHQHSADVYDVYQKELSGSELVTTLPEGEGTVTVQMTYTIVENLFQYYSAAEVADDANKVAKPTTFTEYQTMVSELNGAANASDVVTGKDYTISNSEHEIVIEFQVVNEKA